MQYDADGANYREIPTEALLEPAPGPRIRSMTGWVAVGAAVLAAFTLVAFALAVRSSGQAFPGGMFDLHTLSVPWFRAALLADSFGFYLLFVIVAGYIWNDLRQSAGALADMAALCVTVYIVLGVAGTSLQFAAVGPLFDASNSPNAVVSLSAETIWVALAHSTQHGLWFFEGPVMAFWAIVSGRQLRLAQYTSGILAMIAGAAYLAVFLTSVSGWSAAADVLEGVSVLLLTSWLLIFGTELLITDHGDKQKERLPIMNLTRFSSRG